jgi:hypothetical protein
MPLSDSFDENTIIPRLNVTTNNGIEETICEVVNEEKDEE